jgi:hypothetical protein
MENLAFKAIDTKTIKAPEGQGCPRCGGSVFAAELMLSKGQVRQFHFVCFFFKLNYITSTTFEI